MINRGSRGALLHPLAWKSVTGKRVKPRQYNVSREKHESIAYEAMRREVLCRGLGGRLDGPLKSFNGSPLILPKKQDYDKAYQRLCREGYIDYSWVVIRVPESYLPWTKTSPKNMEAKVRRSRAKGLPKVPRKPYTKRVKIPVLCRVCGNLAARRGLLNRMQVCSIKCSTVRPTKPKDQQ
jgi:hypothetical protein